MMGLIWFASSNRSQPEEVYMLSIIIGSDDVLWALSRDYAIIAL